MNTDSIKKELSDYQGKIADLNKQLQDLEAQKQNVLRVGTRLEGIVAYLTAKIKEIEESAVRDADIIETAVDELKGNTPLPQAAAQS